MAKSRKAAGSQGGEDRVERDAVAELLAAPPEDFTARRAALAKQLTAGGHAAVAAKVRALRKPTRPVWAVNRLAHEASDEVEALLEAAAELQQAQQRLMAGKADAAALRDASAGHRQRLRGLRARAAKLLGEPASSGSAMLDRVEATLNGAASGDEPLREALRAGRITAELSPPTFGPFGGFEAAAAATPATKPPKAAARKDETTAARQDAAAREAREAQARREAEEREAAAAQQEAKAAADALDAAERAVVDAEARVQALQAELKDARDAVARSRLEARSAARAAKAAAQRSQRLRS